jgi:putative Holliday junction resolvase
MRLLGVDYGQRRIGLALSDATALLARPWRSLPAGTSPAASAAELATLLAGLRESGDEAVHDVGAIVVGLPRRLSGEDSEQTQPVRDFAAALRDLTNLEVHLQDERLSSREAESRLAMRERDWRVRKRQLDAASAAVILQDFLDARARDGAVAGADH